MRIVSCPLCHKKMEIIHIGRVEIDRCSRCEGIWLDKGELEELIDQEHERIVCAVKEGREDIAKILESTLGKIFTCKKNSDE